ncbi:SWIM zinc finger family protein [Streptomyces sp. NPDC058469]|uniref:SWIM zinc finger family protein n=1 Tax=Streptomyces sp. NPDC058469 TaxID=3346514 RepID=UPI0036684F1D
MDRAAVDKAAEPQARTRPGDAARAALRRAVAERRAVGASGEDPLAPGDGSARHTAVSSPGDSPGQGTGDGTADRPRDPVRFGTAVPDGGVGEVGQAEQSEDATGDASATVQDAETVQEPAAVADGGSVRPADAAREALRAARGAARKAREDVGARGVGSVSRPAPRTGAGSEGRHGVRGGTGEAGARDLREFLAGAFRLPADVTESAEVTPPAEETAPDNDRPTPGSSHSEALASTSAHASETSARAPETSARASDRTEHPSHPSPTAPDPARVDPTSVSALTSVPVPAPVSLSTPDSDLVPATPRTPSSMASPSRDSDLRRTFPAFSPRPSDRDGDGGGVDGHGDTRFADTWWGNAWVTALEEGALDAKRLLRGRSYAEKGHVDAITVTPGLVLGYVQGSRARPYRVQVRLRTLGDADWERFLDAAADRPGHIAALLDKEMPKSLAESGVPLLPGPGDLEPQCSCPDSGHPCKHAAALCYQTARLLDADPFVLLLLRGRGERPLLDALSRRNAARAARAAQEQEPAPLPGVRATDVLAEPERRLPPLPPPLPMPPHPEQPPVYPAAPGGPDPFVLDQLATDAAARAHALLSTGRDPVGDLTLWQDAVRLAAARPGSGLTVTTRSLYASLAKATGRSTAELARAVAAWRQGGIEGLAVLEEPWDPPAGRFDRARPLLLAADLPAFRPWHNHLTHPHGHVQLRLGRDGLWYAYESEPGDEDWWPRGTPDLDPVGALTGLGAPSEL